MKIEHLGETMTGSLAVVTSHSSGGLMPHTGLLPINRTLPPPPVIRVYLAREENERLMPVTLICQLAGPFRVDTRRLERRSGACDELGETDE